jgi:ribosomal protein S24E
MEIKSDIRNEIFKRNEINAVVESEKNLSFDEARKIFVEETKKPEENIDLYNVKGNFGSNSFVISANVYDSKEDKDKAEQKTQKQRKAEAEAKASSEASAEGPAKAAEEEKKEAPAEEKKEEAPAEEKKEEVKEETPVEEKKEEPKNE